MLKNFEYRLFPTKKQAAQLESQLAECRWLYNHLLEQRKTAYDEQKKSLSLYTQQKTYPKLKKARPSLKIVHSQVLQNVAVRLDLAFQGFFRRLKAREKPGFPRFRGANRYNSMSFPQVPGGCALQGHHLRLFKIGLVKIKLHRLLEGKMKTCTVRRSSTGKWYATFACQVTAKPLRESQEQVGIDVGLESFAHFSNDERIENPRFFRRDEKQLAKAQRRLNAEEKGTPARALHRQVVARIHERVKWRRKDFAHQQARKIVNRYGFICVEDLHVNWMLRNHCLAKSITDAAWTQFFDLLQSKAEDAGRSLVKVTPAYTSQDCSRCGHRQAMSLSQRWFVCPCCYLEISRDLNAALNILALGQQSFRATDKSSGFSHGELSRRVNGRLTRN